MAAGFTLEKTNLKNFENFILEDFSKTDVSKNHLLI